MFEERENSLAELIFSADEALSVVPLLKYHCPVDDASSAGGCIKGGITSGSDQKDTFWRKPEAAGQFVCCHRHYSHLPALSHLQFNVL